MSKELEALEKLKRLRKYFNCDRLEQLIIVEEEFDRQIKILEQSLTPPTEEEVCKALGEYFEEVFKDKVYCDKYTKGFRLEFNHYDYITKTTDDGAWLSCYYLPPRLMIMIAEFYEGLDEVE